MELKCVCASSGSGQLWTWVQKWAIYMGDSTGSQTIISSKETGRMGAKSSFPIARVHAQSAYVSPICHFFKDHLETLNATSVPIWSSVFTSTTLKSQVQNVSLVWSFLGGPHLGAWPGSWEACPPLYGLELQRGKGWIARKGGLGSSFRRKGTRRGFLPEGGHQVFCCIQN